MLSYQYILRRNLKCLSAMIIFLGLNTSALQTEQGSNTGVPYHIDVLLTPTSPMTYEEEGKESPFGIDLVGDATIVPYVERETWNQDR